MPPCVATMVPALRTSAVLALACRTTPPLAALNDTRSSVLAMKPPTVTCAPAPTSTPLGLRMNTLPLAWSCPRISVATPPLMTFSATALAEGCTNLSVSPAATPSVCHSMRTPWVVWLTVVVAPEVTSVALPSTGLNPVPAACAPSTHNSALDTATALLAVRAPQARAISATATKPPAASRQIKRYTWFMTTTSTDSLHMQPGRDASAISPAAAASKTRHSPKQGLTRF